ncbi:hypothetical protein O1L60_34930 [Streptomyces diastatochromogenes]|nr:hypothetical protein [Streptomyces diastatochromogenes]
MRRRPLDPTTLPGALDGLVRSSVVRPPDAAGRLRMLDTIREYGATWLERTGETRTVADRHAAHFRDLARRAETEWHGARQLRWYRTVDAHHTDLRTALDRLLRTDPDAALDLVGSVSFAWSCRGRLREARGGLEQALLLSGARGRVRARALWALGVTLVLQGESRPAQEVSENCAREARYAECAEHAASEGPGDLTLDAAALAGLLALTTGRPAAAYVVVDHVLDAAPGGPADSAARLRCHLVRVFALTGLGRLAEARERALHLRDLCRELDEHWTRTALEYQLALTCLMEGDPAAAAATPAPCSKAPAASARASASPSASTSSPPPSRPPATARAPPTSPAPARPTGAPPASPGAASRPPGPPREIHRLRPRDPRRTRLPADLPPRPHRPPQDGLEQALRGARQE